MCESKIYDIGLPFIPDNHNILPLLSEVFFPNISWGGISVFFMAQLEHDPAIHCAGTWSRNKIYPGYPHNNSNLIRNAMILILEAGMVGQFSLVILGNDCLT